MIQTLLGVWLFNDLLTRYVCVLFISDFCPCASFFPYSLPYLTTRYSRHLASSAAIAHCPS